MLLPTAAALLTHPSCSFGLTAAAEALCAQLHLPDQTCIDLWRVCRSTECLLGLPAGEGCCLQAAENPLAWHLSLSLPTLDCAGGAPLHWPLCSRWEPLFPLSTSAGCPSAGGTPLPQCWRAVPQWHVPLHSDRREQSAVQCLTVAPIMPQCGALLVPVCVPRCLCTCLPTFVPHNPVCLLHLSCISFSMLFARKS